MLTILVENANIAYWIILGRNKLKGGISDSGCVYKYKTDLFALIQLFRASSSKTFKMGENDMQLFAWSDLFIQT